MTQIQPHAQGTIEEQKLANLERVIEKDIQGFRRVGAALSSIRDQGLYKSAGFETFQEYVEGRWSIKRAQAYRLMGAAEVAGDLSPRGDVRISHEGQARPLTRLPPEERQAAWDESVEIAGGSPTRSQVEAVVEKIINPVAANSVPDPENEGDEWYTPQGTIEIARAIMGGIGVDPASCEEAQKVVRAQVFYTKEDDGLTKDWTGAVWCNPPYSQPLIGQFVDKFIKESRGNMARGMLLVNNCTDTAWFHKLLALFPCVILKGRQSFWRPDQKSFAARQGQVIFAHGISPQMLKARFVGQGYVVRAL